MQDKNTKASPVRESLGYCLRQIKQYKKSYIPISAVVILLNAASPFANIIFLPMIINELTGGDKDIGRIFTLAAVMVISETVINGLHACLTVHLAKTEDLFLNASSEEISLRCMEIDFTLTENKAALEQIKKARDGIQWSGGTHNISACFVNIVSYALQLMGVIAVIIASAPTLLLIIGVLLTVQAVINAKKNGIDIKNYSELSSINRIFGHVCWEMDDYRYGKDIRLYGAAGMMTEKSAQQISRMADYFKKINDLKFPLEIGDITAGSLRDFGAYFYLGALAITKRITIGAFSRLLSAGGTLYQATNGIIMCVQDIIKRSNYMYEIIKFMNYPAAMEKGTRSVSGSGGHEIEFRNVSFSYPGSDVEVLKNVSIKLKSGEKLSVVGLNGAGKTTFIKLLCRLYDVDSGEILLDGVNIREYDYEEYMKQFAVVFQDFKLLAFSAADNVLLGSGDPPEAADPYFEKTGLLGKINSLPNGRDTMMFKQFDKEGVELSGGEQQKMAIARALYKNSPVVILDEPTAALDPVAEYEIYRQFNDLVEGKTAVYISHRLSSCKFCEHIAVFSQGTVMEYGTHDELVHKKNGIYAEMFKAQAQYYI